MQIRTIQTKFEEIECKFKPIERDVRTVRFQIQTIRMRFEAIEWKFEPIERDSNHSNENSMNLNEIRAI